MKNVTLSFTDTQEMALRNLYNAAYKNSMDFNSFVILVMSKGAINFKNYNPMVNTWELESVLYDAFDYDESNKD